ncbi:mannose-6-phosphate isomerase, class I [Myceligenerans halotolerans]
MLTLDRSLRLANTVQPYAWGSTDAIPRLLGTEPDGSPAAEMWLGAHASAPSLAATGDGDMPLDELVRQDPERMLGRRVTDRFGPRLPFLLKVLAADQALSLQVHPEPHAARQGFDQENRDGIAIGSSQRSFHDDQHKPEMLVALTQFEALAGLRAAHTILKLLDGLDGKLVDSISRTLRRDPSPEGLREAMEHLLAARQDAGCAADIAATVVSIERRLDAGSPYERADRTVVDLAEQHPGDPGAIASLLMNRVTLEPGEALFTPAAEVHAYLSGVGIEIMASSDNVLRAGLTTKLVDADALVRCTSFAPRPPAVPERTTAGRHGQIHTFRAPVDEFVLSTASVTSDENVTLPHDGPRIVLVLDGAIDLVCENGSTTAMTQGDAVFVPHSAGRLTAAGTGSLVCASVP